jgi:hypothetical protein
VGGGCRRAPRSSGRTGPCPRGPSARSAARVESLIRRKGGRRHLRSRWVSRRARWVTLASNLPACERELVAPRWVPATPPRSEPAKATHSELAKATHSELAKAPMFPKAMWGSLCWELATARRWAPATAPRWAPRAGVAHRVKHKRPDRLQRDGLAAPLVFRLARLVVLARSDLHRAPPPSGVSSERSGGGFAALASVVSCARRLARAGSARGSRGEVRP